MTNVQLTSKLCCNQSHGGPQTEGPTTDDLVLTKVANRLHPEIPHQRNEGLPISFYLTHCVRLLTVSQIPIFRCAMTTTSASVWWRRGKPFGPFPPGLCLTNKTARRNKHATKPAPTGSVWEASDAAAVAYLSKLGDTFVFKEEQRTALKAWLGGKDILVLLQTGFGKSLIGHCDTSQLATGHVMLSHPQQKTALMCCYLVKLAGNYRIGPLSMW